MSYGPPPPPPTLPPPPPPTGYSFAPSGYAVAPLKRTSHRRIVSLFALTLVLVMGVVVGVSAALTPHRTVFICPPNCGHPPTAAPVSVRPRMSGPNAAYTVEYDPSGGNVTSSHDANSVTEDLVVGDQGTLRLFGMPANGQTAGQVAASLLGKHFPNATRVYMVPNAEVGFQPGYGEVDDVNVQSTNGGYLHARLIVMVAVKHDVALVGVALGPYDPYTPDGINDGHPSGVSAEIAFLLDPLLNSFSWQGDPAR